MIFAAIGVGTAAFYMFAAFCAIIFLALLIIHEPDEDE